MQIYHANMQSTTALEMKAFSWKTLWGGCNSYAFFDFSRRNRRRKRNRAGKEWVQSMNLKIRSHGDISRNNKLQICNQRQHWKRRRFLGKRCGAVATAMHFLISAVGTEEGKAIYSLGRHGLLQSMNFKS